MRFHKQVDKMNHEARIGRRSRNKRIIMKNDPLQHLKAVCGY